MIPNDRSANFVGSTRPRPGPAASRAPSATGRPAWAGPGGLRAGLDPDRARDIVWTLIAPEVYELLVGDRGWSNDEYERWLAQALADAITGR
jgi:hypothetical protein